MTTDVSDRFILALDQGTTSSRALIVDREGAVVGMASKPLTQHYPHPGWVEHDPTEILASQMSVMAEVQFKTGIHSDRIEAIGITNQRETTVVWDRLTGQPIARAICWQCRRTAPAVEALLAAGHGDMIRERTGLIPDAYFSASKIAWILDSVPGARDRAGRGELAFGTVDSWLVYKLTGGAVHATDMTNASRTMVFDIHEKRWDEDLLALWDIPLSMMPEVLPSGADYGMTAPYVTTNPLPIRGVVGDQQAALFGHRCFEAGSAKNTYGTGCFMLMNTGDEPVASESGLITTIGIAEGGEVSYALEGSVFVAGALIQWLRDELGIIRTAAETETLAMSVEDTGGVHVVPAFTGLGAPYWDPDARGIITGLTRGTTKAHLVRAALESLAFQTADILEVMQRDAGMDLAALEVDGAAAANSFLLGFQSDLLGIDVIRPAELEATALGAAYIAGITSAFWDGRDGLPPRGEECTVFSPSLTADERNRAYSGWHAAVSRSFSSRDARHV